MNEHSFCPCGSGKIVNDCCLRFDGTLCPKAATVPMPPIGSASANRRCYAADLGNCSNKITGEHYITHGLLRQFSVNGQIPFLSGVKWLQDDQRSLATTSMKANILCQTHNSALSRLDEIGSKFFSRIDEGYGFVEAKDETTVSLFNGHDIERWLLKALCALVFSGNACLSSDVGRNWRPNRFWMSALFLGSHFPINWGLYWSARKGPEPTFRRFSYGVVSNATDGVYGPINSQRLILAMAHARSSDAELLSESVYRPSEIVFVRGATKRTIKLGWDVPAYPQAIRVDVT